MQIVLLSIFALIFGSFASLLSYRLAKKQPIVFTRSKCLACLAPLQFYNLIPLFSWIFQGGKCSKCKAKISIRYPLIELSFLISFLIIYFFFGQKINYQMIIHFLMASTLIVMIIVDLEEYFIPDITQYFLAILVIILLILNGGNQAVFDNILSAFLYAGFGIALYGFFYITTGLHAIGIDDIKFFFITGLMFGINDFLLFMLFSGVFGTVFGSLWQKIKKEEIFPFAPAICLSFFICMLLSEKFNLIDWIGKKMFFL